MPHILSRLRQRNRGEHNLEESQLLRGILEGCILGIISNGETYGYEILSKLEENEFSGIYEGTLYPVLTRLEKKGYISCRKMKSPLGPTRKYFTITETGLEYYNIFLDNYNRITNAADKILHKRRKK